MSDKTSEKETESKSLQNEDQTDSNRSPDIENINKTDAVLPIIKADAPAKEIIIDLNNATTDSNVAKNYGNNKYSVFGYDQNRPPTWVMFERRALQTAPVDSTPLNYDSSRNDFVRLVFTIVLIMILVTAAFVGLVLFQPDMNDIFIHYGMFIGIPAMIVMMGLSYAISCSPCARAFPCNIVILVMSVICMSCICGFVTVRFRTEIVFYAVIATSAVVLVCLLIAFTRFDFTKWMLYIVVIATVFSVIFAIVMITMVLTGTYMRILHIVLLTVSSIISAIILIAELQMILGGKTIELGEDEYALAAFMLYTSIVDLFLKMVQIMGAFDSM